MPWSAPRHVSARTSEIADSARLAGYTKGDAQYRVKDEADLDEKLGALTPGDSLVAMRGPHTYTFLRDAGDKQFYLYDSWTPGSTIHVRGSEGYNERVRAGLTRTDKPMVFSWGGRRSMFKRCTANLSRGTRVAFS
jgi:hypothetical protein